jgi:hypothetical protein
MCAVAFAAASVVELQASFAVGGLWGFEFALAVVDAHFLHKCKHAG